jgi:hypothetical protein
VLDDLATMPGGAAAAAWHTMGSLGRSGNGYVAQAPAGGAFDHVEQVPGGAGASGIRLAFEPR